MNARPQQKCRPMNAPRPFHFQAPTSLNLRPPLPTQTPFTAMRPPPIPSPLQSGVATGWSCLQSIPYGIRMGGFLEKPPILPCIRFPGPRETRKQNHPIEAASGGSVDTVHAAASLRCPLATPPGQVRRSCREKRLGALRPPLAVYPNMIFENGVAETSPAP